jgi:16S rRNA (adenine1518-N6/adenine1519-N6)-dimethyltransferase
VGQKLLGRPGEKEYGPLSILAQLSCRLTRLMKLGPGSFRPAPKVDSAVLLFEPRAQAAPVAQRKALLAFLHLSFAHRRKTLANNWHGRFTPDQTQSLLAAHGLPAAIRAEAVSPAVWLDLFNSSLTYATPS